MTFGNLSQGTLVTAILLTGVFCLLLGAYGGYRWLNGRSLPRKKKSGPPRESLRRFHELSTTLIQTINYERVLDIALDMSLAAFDGSPKSPKNLISAVMLFHDDRLVIPSARGFTSADSRAVFPGTQGALGNAIRSGEPLLVTNLKSDPELNRLVSLSACGAAYLIPLRSGLDIYGLLIFGHPHRDFFGSENRETLDVIAAQAISAMQNAQLYNALEQEKERIIDAQEEARKKLARDLHDGPTQSVSAIAMRVNFARRLLEKDPGEALEELFQIEEMARRTTKEIRHMLFTLRPLVLESQGLKAALEAMAAKVNETYDQNVIVEVDENTIEVLDIGKTGVLFYIVEEALTNARKHAQAEHIFVRLRSLSSEVGLLEVEDDGVGFDVQSVNMFYDNRGSLGLYNLKERTELINGIFQINSRQGHGTKIQVFIPFSDAGIDRLRQARR